MSEVLHSHFIDGAHNVLIIIKVKVGDFRSWTPSVVEIVVFTDKLIHVTCTDQQRDLSD